MSSLQQLQEEMDQNFGKNARSSSSVDIKKREAEVKNILQNLHDLPKTIKKEFKCKCANPSCQENLKITFEWTENPHEFNLCNRKFREYKE